MEFEWDLPKAAANVRKHGVTFDEAATVFLDEIAVSGADPDHSVGEARYITFGTSRLAHHVWHITFGTSRLGKLLAVSHTRRATAIRITSARRLTRTERKIYEEG